MMSSNSVSEPIKDQLLSIYHNHNSPVIFISGNRDELTVDCFWDLENHNSYTEAAKKGLDDLCAILRYSDKSTTIIDMIGQRIFTRMSAPPAITGWHYSYFGKTSHLIKAVKSELYDELDLKRNRLCF